MLEGTRELLDGLDGLAHPERMRRLAIWARTAPDRAEVCAELRERSFSERYLALLAAVMAGDRDGIEAGLRDPDPGLRIFALRSAVRAGDGAAGPVGTADNEAWVAAGGSGQQVGGAGRDTVERWELSAAERRHLYRALRRLAAPRLADGMIAEVRERFGDAEAGALLPACGPSVVRELLPDLEFAVNLRVLARRHPAILLDRVERRLAEADAEERRRIWAEAGGAVLGGAPERVLDLLERYGPADELPGDLSAYARLAAHDPGRVVDLLVAPGRDRWVRLHPLPNRLCRRLAVLPTERLLPLARRLRDRLGGLLTAVAPARRGELYDGSLLDVDTGKRRPGDDAMEALPAAVRIREANRVLDQPAVRDNEDLTLFWSAYLAWPDASAALAGALRAGSAERRAHGYDLLVNAARRSRDPVIVAEVVERLTALRNEQDPVRAAALTALTGAVRLFTAPVAPALTRLTTDAVETRDGSVATSAALAGLAADTLQHHVDEPELREWALRTIDLVGSAARVPVLRRFDEVLRRGQESMVVERLGGWVAAAAERGRYGPLLGLSQALGRRARLVPRLQEMLRAAIEPGTSAWVARAAIELWLDDPRTRAERVAEVLAADPASVAVPVVWRTVADRRTDLLDQVFRRRPRGRLVEPGTRWVPPAPRHPERWVPRQHARFVELHELVLTDPDANVWSRAASLRAVAGIPELGREVLLRHVDAPTVAIAEAALAALPWSDRPEEALPLLLGHAGGDRARVALYAAGRAARFVPPSRLPVLLNGILLGSAASAGGELAVPVGGMPAGPAKITARKEAARLLGAFGPPESMGTLRTAYRSTETYRDVRAAIVSAARQRLGAESSWDVLDGAVRGSREEIDALLEARPELIAARHRRRYAALVVSACRSGDRQVREVAFLRLPPWARWADGVTELVVDRLTDLGEDRWLDTTVPLIHATGGAELDLVFGRLAERKTDPEARRRIARVAGGVTRWVAQHSAADRTAVIAAARWLGSTSFAADAAKMLLALGRLDNLEELADLCADRPVLATRTAADIARRATSFAERPEPSSLHALAERMAGRGDLAGGLFAVAVARHGEQLGWPAAWRDLVLELRRHPVTEVALDAYELDPDS